MRPTSTTTNYKVLAYATVIGVSPIQYRGGREKYRGRSHRQLHCRTL